MSNAVAKMGFCVHTDAQEMVDFVAQTGAPMLFMDDLDAAIRAKQARPDAHIAYRKSAQLPVVRTDARTWLEQFAHVPQNIAIQVGNEDGWDDVQLGWNTQLAVLNATTARKTLIHMNSSCGNPGHDGWLSGDTHSGNDWLRPAAVAYLEALSMYRATSIAGLHEYGHIMVTSSFQDSKLWNIEQWKAAHDLNTVGWMNPDNWPSKVDWSLRNHHVGRYWRLIQACAELEIEPPRVWITEFGVDCNPDMEKDHGFPKNTRGWLQAQSHWQRVRPKISPAAWIYGGMKWAQHFAYPNVEAVFWFCYGSIGYPDGDWSSYDVRPLRNELLPLMAANQPPQLLPHLDFGANQPPTPIVAPAPVVNPPAPIAVPTPQPAPTLTTWKIALIGTDAVRLRVKPNTTSARLDALRDGMVVTSNNTMVIGEKVKHESGAASELWIPVTVGGQSGYISAVYAKLVAPNTVPNTPPTLTGPELAAGKQLITIYMAGSLKAQEIGKVLEGLLTKVS